MEKREYPLNTKIVIFQLFSLLFLLNSITIIILFYLDSQIIKVKRNEIISNGKALIKLEQKIIENDISKVLGDLHFFQESITSTFKTGSDIKNLENIWLYFSNRSKMYDQIRYLDNDGNEKYSKENTQTFGLTLNIPFDSRTLNDVQSKKIDYLKSKINLENNINDEKTFFKTKLEKIAMLDERLQITKDDLEVYNSILKIINEEKSAQIKTQSDLDTLQNSQKIKSLDLKIYEIDKQIELLEMYAKLQ